MSSSISVASSSASGASSASSGSSSSSTVSGSRKSSVSSHGRSHGDNNDQPRSKEQKPKLIVVTDSNGKHLNMHKLKPELEGIWENRYELSEAINRIPKVADPEGVTDIVFQLGLNNLRRGMKPNEIQDQILNIQMLYNQHFPNACQHVSGLPPLSEEHVETNQLLQKLSSFTQSNYISTKVFMDRATGKLRSGLFNDYHYNNIGVKHLAKEIKKSLYSSANKNSQQQANIRTMLLQTPTA